MWVHCVVYNAWLGVSVCSLCVCSGRQRPMCPVVTTLPPPSGNIGDLPNCPINFGPILVSLYLVYSTVSSDTESNNIVRYEHWTYIMCPARLYSLLPSHAILSEIFLPMSCNQSKVSHQNVFAFNGRKVNFSPRYHNWSSPYELYRCISSHCYSDHAWWFARSVHLFRYAPHKRTNIEKISPERSLEIHLFLVPM